MSDFFSWRDNNLILQVSVKTRSSIDALEPGENRLKVKITKAPVDGKANKHLVKYLSKIFSVPQSNISIDRGANQSLKTLTIKQPMNLPDFISR